MKLKPIILMALAIPLLSNAPKIAPSQRANVFSTFQLGKPLSKSAKFLNKIKIKLKDGGKATPFAYDFSSIGGASIKKGVVVSYNDTIRALLLKMDEENGTKLWNGMVEIYGAPQSPTILDNYEWLIQNYSFSMYEVDGLHHARFVDHNYYKKKKLKTIILSEIDYM